MTPPPGDAPVQLYVGPTGHGLPAELLHQDGVQLRPPARRGHIHALIAGEPPGHIALVDGRYDDVPAVGHRELLDALAAGWTVTGLGSIGALRAAELRPYGMTGYGQVFTHLLTTEAPDDEVALLHGPAPAYRPITEALVDLRAFAEHLTQAGVLDQDQAAATISLLTSRWFGDRSQPAFIDAVRTTAGAAAAAAARAHLPRLPTLRVKTQDLRDYLTERPWTQPSKPSRSCPPTAAAGPSSTTLTPRSAC
ncbi:TfuA-like protein [Streptomyces sp. NPDC001795]|uniref:TfuA-like protein n=1 Tax=Streptomyces sp. NPDC001795 TaxID=3154525 RepID=UPI00331B72C0